MIANETDDQRSIRLLKAKENKAKRKTKADAAKQL